ncbi:putative F-box domain-containing protein [Helianthus annuus]|nr:putative F-box domain-containing protein [Helianthus annuus]
MQKITIPSCIQKKMETLEAEILIPIEIMEDIFSRLPIKSILRFRSLSKPWLLRLSSPSFTKLHSTRPHRTSLFISAHDRSARKQHLLSASLDGEPATHLMTVDDIDYYDTTEVQHLNGKSRCFKSVQFTPGHQLPLSRTFWIDHIRCYVERMAPL